MKFNQVKLVQIRDTHCFKQGIWKLKKIQNYKFISFNFAELTQNKYYSLY